MPTVRMSDGNFGIRAVMPAGGGGGFNGDIHLSPQVNVVTPQGVTPQQSRDHGNAIAQQLMPALKQMVQQELIGHLRPGGILRGATGQMVGA